VSALRCSDTGNHARGVLLDGYDGVLLDLDGTAYRGPVAVPGAVESVRAALAVGRVVGYVTNNASRAPQEVAAQLVALGFDADAGQVVTSAQAAAALLAERLLGRVEGATPPDSAAAGGGAAGGAAGAGVAVLVVGTEALAAEVRAVGLSVVRAFADGPAAVVQGHSPETGWAILAEACLAIRAGALWVACNVDPTLPTDRGQLPGNGSMVAALRVATGCEPEVAGKPRRRLLDQAARRLGLSAPLVAGDRLDTDIAGGVEAGMDTLLVLTGVSTPADVLAAEPRMRPTYLAADLSAMGLPAQTSRVAAVPGWSVEVSRDAVTLTAAPVAEQVGGGASDGPVDALRALCTAVWAADVGASDVATGVRAGDAVARSALDALGLLRV
jgi:glycerol-1-phosphatase